VEYRKNAGDFQRLNASLTFDRREKPGAKTLRERKHWRSRGRKAEQKDECDEVEAELC